MEVPRRMDRGGSASPSGVRRGSSPGSNSSGAVGAPQGALSRSLGSSTERGTLPHERILWTAATPSEVSVHSPLTARVPDLPADRDRYLPHKKTFPHKRIFRTASKNFFRIKRITIAPPRRPRAGVPPS